MPCSPVEIHRRFGEMREFNMPKQEKMSVTTGARKPLICVIAERILSWPIELLLSNLMVHIFLVEQ
jgi:hypothetical protein